MARQPDATAQPSETVHRLVGMADACHHVWNYLLANCERRYALWQACRIGSEPSISFFTPDTRFTVLRDDSGHAWLKAYPAAVVRYSPKYLADAYKHFLADPVNEGAPRFKARHSTTPGFTIPEHVDIRDGGSRVPMRDCQPLTVRIRRVGAIGVDRNVGQATDSEGTVGRMTDPSHPNATLKRRQCRFHHQQKGSHRRRGTRDNDTHQIGRMLADTVPAVVVEDLNTKGLTWSARGTKEAPGTLVQAKAEALLQVNAACTSQTCAVCGHVHRGNRPSPAVFACGACGHRAHADPYGAVNILARAGLPPRARSARGSGVAARQGAFPSGTPTTRKPGGGPPGP